MNLADILALSARPGPTIAKADDTLGLYHIALSAVGLSAIPIITSRTAGLTGASEITNIIGITQEGYDAIPVLDPNTYYLIIDALDPISSYYAPGTITSTANVTNWNIANARQAKLTLSENTAINVTNLNDGQTASLTGTISGAGGWTVSIEGSGLTSRRMGNAISDITALTVTGSLFEISLKRSGTSLLYWVSTLSL